MTSRLRALLLYAIPAALMLSAAGCVETLPAWSQFVAFSSGQWSPGMTVDMDPWPGDSIVVAGGEYHLSLCLRYRLPAQRNAVIVVEQEVPGQTLQRDTLRIRLLDDAGSPEGRGAYGLYLVEQPVPTPPRLVEGYSVALHPVTPLTSISEVGLILSAPNH